MTPKPDSQNFCTSDGDIQTLKFERCAWHTCCAAFARAVYMPYALITESKTCSLSESPCCFYAASTVEALTLLCAHNNVSRRTPLSHATSEIQISRLNSPRAAYHDAPLSWCTRAALLLGEPTPLSRVTTSDVVFAVSCIAAAQLDAMSEWPTHREATRPQGAVAVLAGCEYIASSVRILLKVR